MHLATDYIHPTPHKGRCRIRVCLPDEERGAPVVLCPEIPANRGQSVTNSAERIATEVIEAHGLTPFVRESAERPSPFVHRSRFVQKVGLHLHPVRPRR